MIILCLYITSETGTITTFSVFSNDIIVDEKQNSCFVTVVVLQVHLASDWSRNNIPEIILGLHGFPRFTVKRPISGTKTLQEISPPLH